MSAGRLSEVVIHCESLVRILQDRSERYPGDHETQLSDEYLQAGLSCVLAGRQGEALSHLANAERASQTLAELRPTESAHRVRLAVTQTAIGMLRWQSGQIADAETALAMGVSLSQQLTDEDTSNEDLLATALTMLGTYLVQVSRNDEAQAALSRAVVICRKLVAQRPLDNSRQLQLASALSVLGALFHLTGQNEEAQDALAVATTIAQELVDQDPKDRTRLILLAQLGTQRGGLLLFSDKETDAEVALTSAVEVVRLLETEHSDQTTQFLLASALYLLGIAYAFLERETDAEAALVGVVEISRQLTAQSTVATEAALSLLHASTFLGSALYYLGLIYIESGRDCDAESSLLSAVEALVQGPNDPGNQKLLGETLETLTDLYAGQGRAEEAAATLATRRRLDDQSPESPTLA